MDAIVAEHLRKTYPKGVRAVEDVSFRVAPGEIFGLLGPNGAGKTTTVRMLATLTKPDGGTGRVAGHDIRRDPAGVRRALGYVAQSSGVDKHATGRENLTLQAQLHRVPRSEIRQRVDRVLEWVGLADAADRMVRTYSGGMKRRLDIALGLVHEPEVLFLDEPTTGLDPETRTALWEDLLRLKHERRLAVLLTTHYLDEADRLCDRLAIVDRGRVVAEGTPAELKAAIRGDRVTLEVEQRPGEAAAVLAPLDGVLDVVPNGREVVARVLHGATAIPQLVTVLERAGITVQSVALHRPSLDDVYLVHTGHRMISDTLAPEVVGQGEEQR